MARRLKFPHPKDYPPKTPAVLCPGERVLGLYNEQHPAKTAQRISKTVRTWFFEQAHAIGWSGLHFVPEVESHHGAGCVLWIAKRQASITVEGTMLILADSLDDEA
jgi:hypothetical protein